MTDQFSERTRWAIVVVFAIAMAWVEAASVLYIRALVDRIEPYQADPLPLNKTQYGALGNVELVREAATLYEAGKDCGAEANMAKQLAAEASWAAADMCLQTHGGFGFAEEFDIERKFRETRLYTVAPISTNMVLSYIAEHVLGLPRSY